MQWCESEVSEQEIIELYDQMSEVAFERLKGQMKFNFERLPTLDSYMAVISQLKISSAIWSEAEVIFLQYLMICGYRLRTNRALYWGFLLKHMPFQRSESELHARYCEFRAPFAQRQLWTKMEDKKLYDLIQRLSTRKWGVIASEFSMINKTPRTSKQCRERWNNKLDPLINRQQWSLLEELQFLRLLLQVGKKWAEISTKLELLTEGQRRTEFMLKHKFKLICQKSKIKKGKSKEKYNPKFTKRELMIINTRIDEIQEDVLEREESWEENSEQIRKEFKFTAFTENCQGYKLVLIKHSKIQF